MSRQSRLERRAGSRLALRIALRSSARSLGRSALIAIMVGLPVAGLTAITTVYLSGQPSTAQRVVPTLGQNEAQLRVVSAPSATLVQSPISLDYSDPSPRVGDLSTPAEVLPVGTAIVHVIETRVTAATAAGVGALDVTEGAVWAPSFAGKYDVAEGRTPTSDREVMVTGALLERLGVPIGGTVELRDAALDQVTVVGVLDSGTEPDSTQTMFARAGAISGDDAVDPSSGSYYLPDTPLDWAAVQDLNRHGFLVLSRSVMLDPPPGTFALADYELSSLLTLFAIAAVIAGLAAFEVILLAGAAFTVTARQQQRMLATIASVGAPRRLLFRILAAHGVVLGASGGAVGVILGTAGAAVFMLASADGSSTQYYSFDVPWLALLGYIGFAVLVGWIASLAPARAASRFDVVAALRGSRRPPAPSARRPAIGLVLLLMGVAITVVGGIVLAVLMQEGRGIGGGHPLLAAPIIALIIGPVLSQLGLVLCGPLLLRAVATVLRRSGLGARLAARDAARNPSRAVPALAAVMTTVFIAVLTMSMVSAGQENSRREHQYRTPLGTVAIPLSYVEWDATAMRGEVLPYPYARQAEQAVRDTLDVDEVRVLQGAPDSGAFEYGGESPDGGVAVPVVPPANLCPSAPGSPEYSTALEEPGSAEYRAMLVDWRCQSIYVFMSSATGSHIFVGDAADLALALGTEPSAEAVAALQGGAAVSLYPEYVQGGTVTIQWWDSANASVVSSGAQSGDPLRSVSLDAVVERATHAYDFGIFLSPATADRIGLEYDDSVLLASTRSMPSEADRDALTAAMYNLPGNASGVVTAQLELGPPQYATVITWALLGLTGIIALAAAAVAIGLARFDGRQDDATLTSLGARGLVRRSFAFWQAVIITGVGTVLGAGVALIPALALSADVHWPFSPPWLQIGLAVIALPVAIAAGSWLLAGRSPATGRRVSIS